ncbi:hypothetical protein BC831DRAFT_547341 [Entophlyctis helioformis]|nr:hypothetical protein BC831DRAFT_547341 [Entophlyctis helioformis]
MFRQDHFQPPSQVAQQRGRDDGNDGDGDDGDGELMRRLKLSEYAEMCREQQRLADELAEIQGVLAPLAAEMDARRQSQSLDAVDAGLGEISDVASTLQTRHDQIQDELDTLNAQLSHPVLVKSIRAKVARLKRKKKWKQQHRIKVKSQRRAKAAAKAETARQLHALLDHDAVAMSRRLSSAFRRLVHTHHDIRHKVAILAALVHRQPIVHVHPRRRSRTDQTAATSASATNVSRTTAQDGLPGAGTTQSTQDDARFKSALHRMHSALGRTKALLARAAQALLAASPIGGPVGHTHTHKTAQRPRPSSRQASMARTAKDHSAQGKKPPIDPLTGFLLQSQRSVRRLVRIRTLWDACIVAPGTPGGSRVPLGLPEASPPSSEAWAAALVRMESA